MARREADLPPQCSRGSGAGREQAAVDVDDLAGGRGEQVAEQGADHGAHRGGVLGVPAEGGAFVPDVVERGRSGDGLLRQRVDRPGGDEVGADAIRPEVADTDRISP